VVQRRNILASQYNSAASLGKRLGLHYSGFDPVLADGFAMNQELASRKVPPAIRIGEVGLTELRQR
jgi:hypothetical protein